MNSEIRPDKSFIYYAFTIVIAILVVYAQTFFYYFAYDDYMHIFRNTLVADPNHNLSSLFKPFLEPAFPGNLYRPLVISSFRLHILLHGPLSCYFHLINVLIHIAFCLLLYALTNKLLQDHLKSFLIVLLFSIHPVGVEAVANIIGRFELFAAFFGLLACYCFLRRENKFYFLGCLMFALATFSKESAFSFFLLIPLYLYSQSRDKSYVIKVTTFLFLTSLLSLAIRFCILGENFLVQKSNFVYENPIANLGFLDRLFPALIVLGKYVFLLLLPFQLSADYSLSYYHFWIFIFSTKGLLHFLLLFLTCLVFYHYRKTQLFFFALWFLFSFALTLNIMTPIGTIMGERLAYLPSFGLIGFFVLLVFDLANRFKRPKLSFAILSLFFLSCFLQSFNRVIIWENNKTLYQQMVLDWPMGVKTNLILANRLFFTENDLLGAKIYANKTLKLDSGNIEARKLLLRIALKSGDGKQVKRILNANLSLFPEDKELQELAKSISKAYLLNK